MSKKNSQLLDGMAKQFRDTETPKTEQKQQPPTRQKDARSATIGTALAGLLSGPKQR